MVSGFTWFKDQNQRRSGLCTAVVDLGAQTTRVSLIDDEGCALAYVPAPSQGIAHDGAIVELDPLIEGLIHISELSHEKVDSVESVVKEGDLVRAKVINLIPEERKIGLSVKRLSQEESQADYEEFLEHQSN